MRRMLEVGLQTGEIVELDDGGIGKILSHLLLVPAAMRQPAADAKTPNRRNVHHSAVKRGQHRAPVCVGNASFGAEQDDVKHHQSRGPSSLFSFSTSVVRFRFKSRAARPLLPPVFSSDRRISSRSMLPT